MEFARKDLESANSKNLETLRICNTYVKKRNIHAEFLFVFKFTLREQNSNEILVIFRDFIRII